MIDLVYVGMEKPVKEKFNPVENGGFSKPLEDRGFWVSPMCEDGKSYWQHWLEDFNDCNLDDELKHWHIILEPETRILMADVNLSEIRPYLVKSKISIIPYVIDFEKMSKDYDFLYVPDEVVKEHRLGVFMGYDVPTGLFLHPTFRALDDKEFSAFKEEQKKRQEEDDMLLTDSVVQKMLVAWGKHEISDEMANKILMQRLKNMRGK